MSFWWLHTKPIGPLVTIRAVRTENLAYLTVALQSAGFVLVRPITYEEIEGEYL